jgi:hypothetical protein
VGEGVKQNMQYNLVRKQGAVEPPARFDERDVKTDRGEASEAPATERAGNRYAEPIDTASHLDSTRGQFCIAYCTSADTNRAPVSLHRAPILIATWFHSTRPGFTPPSADTNRVPVSLPLIASRFHSH